MKKLLMFIKRKNGLSQEEFRAYYEKNHAPLALKLLPSCFSTYRRNYIIPGATYRPGHLAGVNTDVEPDFDVVTEVTFATEADYQKMLDTLNNPKLGVILAEDEERFVDRKAIVMYLVDEQSTAPELLRREVA
jgi:hypothetical protein